MFLQDYQRHNHQEGHEQDGEEQAEGFKGGIAFTGVEVVATHILHSSP